MRLFTLCQRAAALKRTTVSRSFSAAVVLALILAGCASPGAPVTRNTQKPQAVTDLSARQSGNSIILSFTLPTKTARGQDLAGAPAIEIYRAIEGFSTADPGHKKKPSLLVTIPPQMVNRYEAAGRVTFPDVLTPQDLAGVEAVYEVHTRVGRSSSDASSSVRIPFLPAPQPIHDLRAQIADSVIELAWSASEAPSTDSARPARTYNVYRAEVPGSNAAQLSGDQASASPAAEQGGTFKLLGNTSQLSYSDSTPESGRTYAYVVRTVVKYTTGSVESQDSNRAEITFAPISRPAAPEQLVGTIMRANEPATAVIVELSWAISSETNVAGYNVYRSDTESGAGTRVNSSLVLVPIFRDASVAARREYFYRVTAVNRAGEESEPSAAVAVNVPDSNEQRQDRMME